MQRAVFTSNRLMGLAKPTLSADSDSLPACLARRYPPEKRDEFYVDPVAPLLDWWESLKLVRNVRCMLTRLTIHQAQPAYTLEMFCVICQKD